jgi:hypothetical protein
MGFKVRARCLALLTVVLLSESLAWAQDQPPADPTEVVAKPPADDRRRTAHFISNLGRNTIGVFSRDNLMPFVLGAAATGVSTAFDDDVKDYFAPTRRAKWLGDAVDVEGQPYVIVPLATALYVTGRLSPSHKRYQAATYDIAQATIVEAVYSTTLKYATHRLRPNGSNYLSFPSGHTSNAFSWATVAMHYYGPKLGVPAYLLAGVVGYGRLEKNVHYLSDVVAGATLGILVGRTVVRKDSDPLPRATQVTLSPSRDSYGTGMGLQLHVDF